MSGKHHRKRGRGSVWPREGAWVAQLPRPTRAIVGTYRTEAEAHAALDAALDTFAPLSAGGVPARSGTLATDRLGDFLAEWLARHRPGWPRSTYLTYRSVVARADAVLGAVRLCDLGPEDGRRLVAALQ